MAGWVATVVAVIQGAPKGCEDSPQRLLYLCEGGLRRVSLLRALLRMLSFAGRWCRELGRLALGCWMSPSGLVFQTI